MISRRCLDSGRGWWLHAVWDGEIIPTRYLSNMRLILFMITLQLTAILAGCAARPHASSDEKPVLDDTPILATNHPLLPEEPPPAEAARVFRTDFSRHTVPYAEILSGGPSKDDIPSIDTPRFVPVADADRWLRPNEPVILLDIDNDVRAYPVRIIIWHELVNDMVGGRPVLISFCPLCNTAIAFDRRVGNHVLDFGTTGYLHYSNLIMYDRQTENWWQQATGEAIAGKYAGALLSPIATRIVPWSHLRETYPEAKVLSGATGHTRDYGRNPYAGYDDISATPFLYHGPATPSAFPPMEHVLGLSVRNGLVAYPYSVLARKHVVNDTIDGVPVVIFWQPGMTSGLNGSEISGGDDIGSAAAFESKFDGRVLRFAVENGEIVDDLTGNVWNGYGISVSKPSPGKHLAPLNGINAFWFVWSAFHPNARVYTGH
ncbi:MAG: DUF3179 domain-containing protein [Candidatus Kapaibacterium sp.]